MSSDGYPRVDFLKISGRLLNDKYLVGDVVGEGGFCIVYKAEHTIWHQPVALKVFKLLANASQEHRKSLLDSFIQEGRLMASLSSRCAAIVQARDVDTFTTPEGEWLPYMVLEWLDGKPLDLVMHEERWANMPARQIHECLALLEPAAIAFELAHRQNIAHRDVKPANIFVMGDPRGIAVHIKVLDFGIAKVMAEHVERAESLAATGKDVTAFTPNYGAPEQFSRQHGATGPWTDVYSMALIMVELLRGGLPALEGNDFMQVAFASRDPGRRPTPRTHGVEVSHEVEAVFQRALAVNPADRYHTMGEFWSALHHAVFPSASSWSPVTTTGMGVMSGRGLPSMHFRDSGSPPPPTAQSAGSTPPPRPASAPPPTPMMGPPTPPTPPNPGLPPPPSSPSTAAPHMTPISQPPKPSRAPLVFASVAAVALLGGGLFALKATGRLGGGEATPEPKTTTSAIAPVTSQSATAPIQRLTSCPADMVLVPGGKFFMGTSEKDPALSLARPAHKVMLDSFCIDVFEVTAEDYKSCSDVGECIRPNPVPEYPKNESESAEEHEKKEKTYSEFCNFGKPGREKHPINCVTWTMSDAFCKWKHRRLPTEAEWEYAARGSDGRKYPWGDEAGDATFMNACGTECNKWESAHQLSLSQTMYNADDGFAGTAPVGSFPKGKTKFGSYDFVGNVWEWTADYFEIYKEGDQVNPTGAPQGDKKAIRGGAFNGGVQAWLNPAFRYHMLATASSHGIGFRCAATL